MARTLLDDERNRRIVLIGNYFLKTGKSTRQIAEYFTQNYFPISNYTVADYIKRFKAMNPKLAKDIEKQIKGNTPETVDDPKVKARVLKVASLVLQGMTLEEITNSTEYDYWVLYRDIHNRLPKIDKQLSNQINEIFKNRSLDNLGNKNK